MKKKKLDSAVDEDADGLIKEATATMRQMSQHFTSNTHTKNDNHIATFCHFVNSELTSILQASNNTYVNKAKRKIQLCLFDIWDQIETGNLQERPCTRSTYNSENSVGSETASQPGSLQERPGCTRSTYNSENSLGSETANQHESLQEIPTTRSTNYSENSVVSGTASSLVIKRNGMQPYNSPQSPENRNVEYCTEYEIDSSKEIVYYINNYDPK